MRKAQVFSADLIVGLSIGIIVFAALFGAWTKTAASLNENIAYEDMVFRAMMISDVLVKDSALGIASTPYIIDSSKLDEIISQDYEDLRERFNIKPNGFYFSLAVNGSYIKTKGTAGTGNVSASVRRAVLYNGTGAVLEFRIKKE